jgi:hypothetical protein
LGKTICPRSSTVMTASTWQQADSVPGAQQISAFGFVLVAIFLSPGNNIRIF